MSLRLAVLASALAGGLLAASTVYASPASTTASLNVRAGAGTSYPAVAVLPPNTFVDVRFCPSSWCQVSTNYGVSGWVSSRYLNFGPGGFQPNQPPPTYYPPSQGYYPPPPPPPAYYPPANYYPPAPPPPYGGNQCWSPDYGYCDAYFNDQAWWWYDNGWHQRPRASVSFSIGFRG